MTTKGNNTGKTNTTGNKDASSRSTHKPSTIDLDPKEVREVVSETKKTAETAAKADDKTPAATAATATAAASKTDSKTGGVSPASPARPAGTDAKAPEAKGSSASNQNTGSAADKKPADKTPDNAPGKPDRKVDAAAAKGSVSASTATKTSVPPTSTARPPSAPVKVEKKGAGFGSMLFSGLLGGGIAIGGLGMLGQTENPQNIPYLGALYGGGNSQREETATSQLQAKVDELSSQIAKLQDAGSSDDVTSRIAALEQKLDGVTSNAAGNAGGASGSEQTSSGDATSGADIDSLKQELASISSEANSNGDKLEQLTAKLETLTTSLSDTSLRANDSSSDTTTSESGTADSSGSASSAASTAASTAALAAATASIAELKTQLSQLGKRMEEGGSAASSQAVTAGQDDELKSSLEELSTRLSSLESEASAIKSASSEVDQTLSGQEEKLTGLNSQLEEMTGKVSTLETAVNETLPDQLEDVRKTADAAKASEVVARSVAAASLKAAAENGDSLATPLASVEALEGGNEDIKILKELGAKGIPTDKELLAGLDQSEDAILAALQPKVEGGYLDKLMASAKQIVKVRPVGAVEGDTPEAIFSRIRAAVQQNDLDAAVSEWDSLPQAGKDAGASWIEAVKKRQQGMKLVDKIVSAMAQKKTSDG